jgi:SOS-response transcriptional repressor LexA
MALFFGVSADYLLGNTSQKNTVQYITESNIPVVFDVHITDPNTATVVKTKEFFWYCVNHDGFQTAGILSGDLLLIEPCDEIKYDDSIYLVQLENTYLDVCRIVIQDDLLIFHMLNSQTKTQIFAQPSQEKIQVVGKVLELKRSYT